ncbi:MULTISPECIES: hypothetical protein [Bacillus cereus group]|uniref:hypothetical protein n=1 Tax=Bacillus cereus group TaxID=86661 RepID=UPI000BEDD846|nr:MULTISPECIES: hypothetical protein [Bacillus cereus group]PEF88516.1 hypothetical protein CON51_04750 [Bacillus thuringiensis]PES54693.1 hypothetical protein CN506_19550 [Bacillus thuringiensis]PFP03615.1 hypothetical protein COJ91_22770 [Bacillus thuringiensis]PFS55649.1 hypothetical protein COK64_23160 [Bacillus thuringiensis]PGL62301.1 hypothetical protein CN939_19325 [Bacillus thuringiensis]
MLTKIKNVFTRKEAQTAMLADHTLKIGDKKVRVRKVTPKEFKELIAVTGNIPNLVIQVMNAPEDQYAAYALAAVEAATDDFVAITSQLTGIDEDYLHHDAGMSEIVEYLVQMVEYNDLNRMVKNVASLLPKATETEATSNEATTD